jgi:uncharacterized membrane protein
MSEIEKTATETTPLNVSDPTTPTAKRNVRSEFSASYHWSAPLPPPDVLARYNEAFPGCAERIVAMAEKQSAHRQNIESRVINGNIYSQKVGLWLGFVLAFVVISSGAWLVYDGRIAWGAGFIGIPLVALVSVFVLGKRDQNRQLRQSQPEENPQQKLPFPE